MMCDYLKTIATAKAEQMSKSVMSDMILILLESALDEVSDEEVGYSMNDYWNKDTDNNRNGHPRITMYTCYGARR